ncbi:thiamine phosphate synthase [bacterium]|nr:MAG: thiamine phosphate synthase [bacterium]
MKPNLSLYLIADTEISTCLPFLQTIERALMGGVTIVQLRSKNNTFHEFMEIARAVRVITSKYQVPFIINDNIQVACEIDADGVHLGQGDLPIEQARKILGHKKIIGISTHNPEEAYSAEIKGADYVGAGTVFPTVSKDDITGIIGVEGVRKIVLCAKLPVVAIGGIDVSNAAAVMETGVTGVAVISSIMKSDTPRETAECLRAIIDRQRKV